MRSDKHPTSNGNGGRVGAQVAHVHPPTTCPFYEVLTSDELAERWHVPASWVREQVRSRAADPIPHLRFGRYVRFRWGAPDLEDWLARRSSKAQKPGISSPLT
jgi:hypothetical protein